MKVGCIDSGICMNVLGCRGEGVYGGNFSGLYVCEFAELSSYVDFYKNVDIVEGHGVVFYVVSLVAWV